MAAETKRCNNFRLDLSTNQGLTKILDEVLLKEHAHILLDTEVLTSFFRDGRVDVLGRVYTLLSRIGLQESLKGPLDQWVIDEGTLIIFDEEREEEMVHRLLRFKDQMEQICAESFKRDDEINHSSRLAFAHFINQTRKTAGNWGTDNSKPGEMIAKYIDLLLRGGAKFVASEQSIDKGKGEDMTQDPEEEVNRRLDKVLSLFRFVHGKDVFEAFYKNNLARRLLLGRSASDDAEKMMLGKLREECGTMFTHNLESMFKDIEIAREEMSAYKMQLREQGRQRLDFDALVLSAAAWPSYPDAPAKIPQAVAEATQGFEDYHRLKHSGRGLTWKHSLSYCQLRANFPSGRKDIIVSGFQAIVLLLFNDVPTGETLSYATIKDASGLSDADVERTLQSLACGRYRVLTKSSKGRDVHPTDTFSYNASFSDSKMRIKINQVQLKETKEENKETHERVEQDRKFEAQAAIVRIMKSRKVISHAELMAEVITATRNRGVLDPAVLKKQIEKMIEDEYIEREGNGYSYVA